MTRQKVATEIIIVLAITFGMSGLRSVLTLIDALLRPASLNQQSVTLNSSQSAAAWLDGALQLCSSGLLFAWGALALYLLGTRLPRPRLSDAAFAPALAAIIGLPGLGLYVTALHLGWTRQVIPGAFVHAWVEVPSQLLWSGANAFAEEVVVVMWFISRLTSTSRGLGLKPWQAVAAAAVLRGSYHLYQGISAGFGNLAMGIIFGWFYLRTGRVWPLILAHFLIDAIAFIGYPLVANSAFLRA